MVQRFIIFSLFPLEALVFWDPMVQNAIVPYPPPKEKKMKVERRCLRIKFYVGRPCPFFWWLRTPKVPGGGSFGRVRSMARAPVSHLPRRGSLLANDWPMAQRYFVPYPPNPGGSKIRQPQMPQKKKNRVAKIKKAKTPLRPCGAACGAEIYIHAQKNKKSGF